MRPNKIYEPPDPRVKEESDKAYANQLRYKSKIDSEWGFNRLLGLISPDTKTKMFRQIQLLAQAVGSGDYEKVKLNSEAMIRGLDVCVGEAKSQGFEELNPSIWVTNHPKTNVQIFIALNNEEMPRVMAMADAEKPSLYFSIKEIFNLIKDDHEILDLKTRFGKTFGNVEIVERRPVTQEDVDNSLCDEII